MSHRTVLVGYRGDGQQLHHLARQPGKAASQHIAHRGRHTRHRSTIK
jgi:hypothetical protein